MPVLTPVLTPYGPVVDVVIAPSTAMLAAVVQRAWIPTSVIPAIIDTGARRTVIDPTVAEELGLETVSSADLATPGGARRPRPVYAVRLDFAQPSLTFPWDALPVIGEDLAGLGAGALLGRDVLSRCLFLYHGPAGTIALSY